MTSLPSGREEAGSNRLGNSYSTAISIWVGRHREALMEIQRLREVIRRSHVELEAGRMQRAVEILHGELAEPLDSHAPDLSPDFAPGGDWHRAEGGEEHGATVVAAPD